MDLRVTEASLRNTVQKWFFLLQTLIGPLAARLTKLSNLPQLSKLNSLDSMACYGIFMKGYDYVVWVNVKFS